MFRKEIIDGDLIVKYKPWYGLPGTWKPYRNLSEEVRKLKTHADNAASKAADLKRKFLVAESNVKADLHSLQRILLDNSDVHFHTDTDNSILEEREGVKYSFKQDNKDNKQDASSNKDKQQQQTQENKQQDSGRQRDNGRVLSVGQLLNSKIILN
jgi:hypothetical protein